MKGENRVNYIGKILPVDGYYVVLKEELPVNYQVALTHLYQPLIGGEAIALYQTLLGELNFQNNEPQTHHTLMNYLTLPLTEIYKARLKLEGIGLLSTLKKNYNNQTTYTYELRKPFAPKDFFKDAMLSQLLYHHIGKLKYDSLREHYETDDTDWGEEVTASFHDVFETFRPTLDSERAVSNSNSLEEESPSANEQIDFSWLVQALQQRMIPVARVLTPENRKMIIQLMSLYDLTSYDIEKALLWALKDDNQLDHEEFKTACHDLFKSKNHATDIQLTDRISIPKPEQTNKPKTKEEMLIQELETMSPKQLLEDFSSGNRASDQDLKAVREVMTTQGLPTPVMNVLIHYVLLQTNMKLSKGYLEKIASHWSRMNLKTAKEAMDFAKKEKAKFDQKRKTNYRKPASKEVIPEWFEERKQQRQQQKSAEKQSYTLADLEKEKARLKQQ
jgi:replication initiation and membrane attachment protein